MVDLYANICYKYNTMVKHNKRCTGLGGSTRRLHHKHILRSVLMMGMNRIDWQVVGMWSCPDVSSVNANKTIIANDNFASEDFALAA